MFFRYKRKGIDLVERIARAKVNTLTTSTQLQDYIKHLPTSSLATIYKNQSAEIPNEILDLIRVKDRQVTVILLSTFPNLVCLRPADLGFWFLHHNQFFDVVV